MQSLQTDSFYIDVQDLNDFKELKIAGNGEEQNHTTNVKTNDIFKYYKIDIGEVDNHQSLNIGIFSAENYKKSIEYQVFRLDKDGDPKNQGWYQADQFSILNPVPHTQYLIFVYGNTIDDLNITTKGQVDNAELINNLEAKTINLKFKQGKKENYHYYFKEIGSDQIAYYNLTITEISEELKDKVYIADTTCRMNSHCIFDYLHKGMPSQSIQGIEILNKKKDIKYNTTTNNGYLMLQIGTSDTIQKEEEQELKLQYSVSQLEEKDKIKPDDNGDDDDGEKTWIIIGIVLGCILAVSVIGFFGLKYYRKKKQQSQGQDLEYNNDIDLEEGKDGEEDNNVKQHLITNPSDD